MPRTAQLSCRDRGLSQIAGSTRAGCDDVIQAACGCTLTPMPMIRHVRAHQRLLLSLLLGALCAAALSARLGVVPALLVGWNVAVWLYLALIGLMMLGADHAHLRRMAAAQAEGAATVLAVVAIAAVASLVGIVVELAAAKLPGAHHAWSHVLFALSTVVGSWLLLPVLFTLTYASVYFAGRPPSGLNFPESGDGFTPHYSDFLYFAFTIAVASQTADVSVNHARMRRLVLAQSLLSFVFNTAILALSINIAASMF